MTLDRGGISSLASAAGRRMNSFSAFVSARPVALVLGFLIAWSLLRTGVALWNWFLLSPQLLTDWSQPANAFQSNLLFNAFGTLWLHVFGAPTDFPWMATQVMIAVVSVTVITWIVHRRTAASTDYLATAVLLSSGIAAVLWREIGRYDFIFLVAIAVGFLVRRPAWMWAGLAVAALSAPEQAALAGIGAVLLTLTPPLPRGGSRRGSFWDSLLLPLPWCRRGLR